MNQIPISIGPLQIHTLWLLVGTGIITSMMMLHRISLKSRTKIKVIFNHIFFIAVWALVSARIIYIATNWQLYSLRPITHIFYIWDHGLSATGTFIGILLATAFLASKYKENIFSWTDKVIICLIAATVFGDIGAFFEGIGYGNETTLPWGVTYESGTIKYAVPIHPVQIYSAIYGAIITVLLYQLNKTKFSTAPGNITALALLLYSGGSFIESFFRGDDTILFFGFRIDLIISLIVFISTGLIWIFTARKAKVTKQNQ